SESASARSGHPNKLPPEPRWLPCCRSRCGWTGDRMESLPWRASWSRCEATWVPTGILSGVKNCTGGNGKLLFRCPRPSVSRSLHEPPQRVPRHPRSPAPRVGAHGFLAGSLSKRAGGRVDFLLANPARPGGDGLLLGPILPRRPGTDRREGASGRIHFLAEPRQARERLSNPAWPPRPADGRESGRVE